MTLKNDNLTKLKIVWVPCKNFCKIKTPSEEGAKRNLEEFILAKIFPIGFG
jgi:hypothetical protein